MHAAAWAGRSGMRGGGGVLYNRGVEGSFLSYKYFPVTRAFHLGSPSTLE